MEIVEPATNVLEQDIATLASGASVSFIGKLGGRGLNVLGQVVIARLLGPASYGLFAIGFTILRMVNLLAPLGLDKGAIRFGAPLWRRDQPGLRSVIFRSLGLTLLSGVLVGMTLFALSPEIEIAFRKVGLATVIRWIAIAVPLVTGLQVAAAVTRISQRMKFDVYSKDLGQPVLNLALLGLFFSMGWRLVGALAATTISFGGAFLLALIFIKRLFPQIFNRQLKATVNLAALLKFSIPASLAGAFTIFLMWVDRLLVGYFLPAADTGVYQAISQSSVLFAVILGAFQPIFMPMIADLSSRGEHQRLQALYQVSTKWGLYLSIPVFVVICLAPREIMTVVFGSRYESGWAPLVILSIGQMINVGTGAVGLLLVMSGHQNRWVTISGMMLVVNVLINVFLIPRYGLIGAAAGTAFSLAGMYLLGLHQVYTHLKIWPFDHRYFKGIIAGLIAALLVWVVRELPVASDLVHLVLMAGFAGLTFLGMLWVLRLEDEDWQFIRLAQRRLQRWNSTPEGPVGGIR